MSNVHRSVFWEATPQCDNLHGDSLNHADMLLTVYILLKHTIISKTLFKYYLVKNHALNPWARVFTCLTSVIYANMPRYDSSSGPLSSFLRHFSHLCIFNEVITNGVFPTSKPLVTTVSLLSLLVSTLVIPIPNVAPSVSVLFPQLPS